MMASGFELHRLYKKSGPVAVWRIAPLEEQSGLLIEYGRQGDQLRMHFVPWYRCAREKLQNEADRLITKKMGQGFIKVSDDVPAASACYVRMPYVGELQVGDPSFAARLCVDKPIGQTEARWFAKRLAGQLGLILNRIPGLSQRRVYHTSLMLRTFTRGEASEPLQITDLDFWKQGSAVTREHGVVGAAFACLANTNRESIALTDESAAPIALRECVARLVDDADELLEQIGIVKTVKMSAPATLGTWFF